MKKIFFTSIIFVLFSILVVFAKPYPNNSTSKHPGTITYNQQGIYTIKLEVDNQDDNYDSKEITLEIKDAINIGFNTEIIDNNYPPTEVILTNNTTARRTR